MIIIFLKNKEEQDSCLLFYFYSSTALFGNLGDLCVFMTIFAAKTFCEIFVCIVDKKTRNDKENVLNPEGISGS